MKCALPFLLAATLLLFAACTSVPSAATASSKQASLLEGSWIMGGPYNEGQPCRIYSREGVLFLENEMGGLSSARFTGPRTFVAENWEQGRILGTVNAGGTRIDWSNGTWWLRRSRPGR